MQGKKNYTEKLFLSFQLSDRIPKDNLYRRLRETLDLSFLYKDTKEIYGKTGNPSIDPVVFFKLLITGYLENITSDRKLMEHCCMRMDVLYFLGYDLDEELPWHSTISRTRQLYPESLFVTLFNKVFALCVDSGMVSGHTQAVDSAPIKANAYMESVVPKMPADSIVKHLKRVSEENAVNKERQAKTTSPVQIFRSRARAEARGEAPPKPEGQYGTPGRRVPQEGTPAKQQDALQSPRSGCPYIVQARQGQKAQLPLQHGGGYR